jgi:hypothetical protein
MPIACARPCCRPSRRPIRTNRRSIRSSRCASNIALAKADGGEAGADEFTALSAALGEALAVLPRRDIIATLEYRERALLLKVKPNMVDAAALGQLRAALAARKLDLVESSAGSWQIRAAAPQEENHERDDATDASAD